MKKIKVKTYLEKDKPIFTKRFYFILIGLGLALLMVGSILQFGSGDEEVVDDNSLGVVKYNGYTFNNVNGKWVLDFNGEPVSFDYLPNELNEIYTENLLFGNKVYIAVDPEDNINNYFIQRIKAILQYKGILAVNACIKEEGCGDIPVVGCDLGESICDNECDFNGDYSFFSNQLDDIVSKVIYLNYSFYVNKGEIEVFKVEGCKYGQASQSYPISERNEYYEVFFKLCKI